jgi:hypothetical protein
MFLIACQFHAGSKRPVATTPFHCRFMVWLRCGVLCAIDALCLMRYNPLQANSLKQPHSKRRTILPRKSTQGIATRNASDAVSTKNGTGSREIGFGIIGCGVIGPWHAAAIARVQGARLVACADPNKERAQKCGRGYLDLLKQHDITKEAATARRSPIPVIKLS